MRVKFMTPVVYDDFDVRDVGKRAGRYPCICFVAVATGFLPAIREHEMGRTIRQLLLEYGQA